MKKLLFFMVYVIGFGFLSKYLYTEYKENKEDESQKGGIVQAVQNYKYTIDSLATEFKLPAHYLMALLMLESSGRKKVPVRYEKKIFKQLLQLKKAKIRKFENLQTPDVEKVSNRKLKKLACSYGPFQIMGYKSFILDVPFDTLIGKNHMYYAVKWIDTTYGEILRNGEYENAFHIHNAGKKFPKDGKAQTHDPEYVEKGIVYLKYFKKEIYKN